MKGFAEGISKLFEDTGKFMRLLLPGYIFLGLYHLIGEGQIPKLDCLIDFWVKANFTKLIIFQIAAIGAILGLIIYATHKTVTNLINVIIWNLFDGNWHGYSSALMKNRLYRPFLDSMDFNWSLTHLVLMTTEIAIGLYWLKPGSFCNVPLPVWLVFGLSVCYYGFLLNSLRQIHLARNLSLGEAVDKLYELGVKKKDD